MTNDIPSSVFLDDLHPARFLKVTDLTERWSVKSIVVTISRMATEDTIPNARDIDPDTRKPRVIPQPVIYFKTKDGKEFPRGYLLSSGVDVKSLKSSTGARLVGEVIGKQITIHVGEFKQKPILRIDSNPPAGKVDVK